MMVPFLSRAFLMVLGYAYPAYECYKTVELNKPEIEQLRFWCQYWILVALLTVFERFGDAFMSWLPMYSEVKLAFFVYLWYPKTKGTKYIYDTFFQPYMAKHETEIDRRLLDLKTRMADLTALCWQRAVNYGQTRFFEIMQYVTSGSPSQTQQRRSVPHPVQELQEQQQTEQPTTPKRQEPPAPPVPPSVPPSPTKSRLQDRTTARSGSSLSKPPKSSSSPLRRKTESASRDANEEQAPTTATSANINGSQETIMEEASNKARGRLRKLAPISGTATN